MFGIIVFLCVSAFVAHTEGAAIPMWEFLSKDEKMSYLYSTFANQVEEFCETTTMQNCNHELLKFGLKKLKEMSEDHLDIMDPYQRGAQSLIWDSMMEGHVMMRTTKRPRSTTTAKPNSYEDQSFGDFGSQSEASAKIETVFKVAAPKGFVYEPKYNVLTGTPQYKNPQNEEYVQYQNGQLNNQNNQYKQNQDNNQNSNQYSNQYNNQYKQNQYNNQYQNNQNGQFGKIPSGQNAQYAPNSFVQNQGYVQNGVYAKISGYVQPTIGPNSGFPQKPNPRPTFSQNVDEEDKYVAGDSYENLPIREEYGRQPLTGPMVVRVFPDGTPVKEEKTEMPGDEDLKQYQLSKTKIPLL